MAISTPSIVPKSIPVRLFSDSTPDNKDNSLNELVTSPEINTENSSAWYIKQKFNGMGKIVFLLWI